MFVIVPYITDYLFQLVEIHWARGAKNGDSLAEFLGQDGPATKQGKSVISYIKLFLRGRFLKSIRDLHLEFPTVIEQCVCKQANLAILRSLVSWSSAPLLGNFYIIFQIILDLSLLHSVSVFILVCLYESLCTCLFALCFARLLANFLTTLLAGVPSLILLIFLLLMTDISGYFLSQSDP